MRELQRSPNTVLTFVALMIAASLTGCGGDDDGPIDPGPPPIVDFTEDIAVSQTAPAVAMVVRILDEMPGYADGVGAKVSDDDFVYDETRDRWEADSSQGPAGYSWALDVFVQYLNAGGLPEQDVDDAVQMRFGYTGTARYDAGGVVIDQTHDSIYSMSGIDAAPGTPRSIFGDGEYTMDYSTTGSGTTTTTRHKATWDIDNAGITMTETGCPTGTVIFQFDPFELRLVFDGSPTATYTLLNENNNTVAAGTGATTLTCGP